MFPILVKLLVKSNPLDREKARAPKTKVDNPILEEYYDSRGRRFYLSRDAPIVSEDFEAKPESESKGIIIIL